MKWTEEDFDREEDEGHNNICRAVLSQPAVTFDAQSNGVLDVADSNPLIIKRSKEGRLI